MEKLIGHYKENSGDIHLLYKRNANWSDTSCIEAKYNETESALDLTGSPLKVDLNATREHSIIFENVPEWPQEENTHGAISYNEARLEPSY